MKNEIIEVIRRNGYTLKGIENFFKVEFLAMDTNYTSAILKINGIKFNLYVIKPWGMCPNGKIEVNNCF